MVAKFKHENLHPKIAAAYRTKVTADLSTGVNVVLQKATTIGLIAGITAFALSICVLIVFGWVGLILMFASPFVFPVVQKKAFHSSVATKLNMPEMLHAVLPQVAQSHAEREYVQAVLAALSTNALEESALEGIVRHMNELLSSFYELEQYREKLRFAKGSQSVASMDAEIRALTSQISETADDVTLGALRQNLEICRAQREDVQVTETALERIEAQQAVIVRTLSSVHSALGRSQIATTPLHAPELERIRDMALLVTNQARAVEQAVQEVVTLKQ